MAQSAAAHVIKSMRELLAGLETNRRFHGCQAAEVGTRVPFRRPALARNGALIPATSSIMSERKKVIPNTVPASGGNTDEGPPKYTGTTEPAANSIASIPDAPRAQRELNPERANPPRIPMSATPMAPPPIPVVKRTERKSGSTIADAKGSSSGESSSHGAVPRPDVSAIAIARPVRAPTRAAGSKMPTKVPCQVNTGRSPSCRASVTIQARNEAPQTNPRKVPATIFLETSCRP